jgi:hypothetical protein
MVTPMPSASLAPASRHTSQNRSACWWVKKESVVMSPGLHRSSRVRMQRSSNRSRLNFATPTSVRARHGRYLFRFLPSTPAATAPRDRENPDCLPARFPRVPKGFPARRFRLSRPGCSWQAERLARRKRGRAGIYRRCRRAEAARSPGGYCQATSTYHRPSRSRGPARTSGMSGNPIDAAIAHPRE